MRSLLMLSLMFAMPAVAHAKGAHGHDEAAKSVTLVGEVIDLACYLQHPKTGQGPEHAQCARQCINKGLPAGLKVGDKLYLLLGAGHDGIVDKVAPLAGKQVTVTGSIITRDGLPALVLQSIAAKP